VRCLDALHARNIVHLDIKPANVMRFVEDDCWKVIDLSSWAPAGTVCAPRITLRYAPPEALASLETRQPFVAQTSADMFSLGACCSCPKLQAQLDSSPAH
jgi:serine/threonine protein kinase